MEFFLILMFFIAAAALVAWLDSNPGDTKFTDEIKQSEFEILNRSVRILPGECKLLRCDGRKFFLTDEIDIESVLSLEFVDSKEEKRFLSSEDTEERWRHACLNGSRDARYSHNKIENWAQINRVRFNFVNESGRSPFVLRFDSKPGSFDVPAICNRFNTAISWITSAADHNILSKLYDFQQGINKIRHELDQLNSRKSGITKRLAPIHDYVEKSGDKAEFSSEESRYLAELRAIQDEVSVFERELSRLTDSRDVLIAKLKVLRSRVQTNNVT